MKRYFLAFLLLFSGFLFGQIPAGYYNAAYNKSEYQLKTALFQIIKNNYNQISYPAVWNAFETTDKRPDGKVWDMYSNCTFTFGTNQCGNYKNICDCFNREHSFPASWFNDKYPMYSDLFQLCPTDGKVNNYRSNYPYGETNGTAYGTAKLGNCTFPGYSGTVFEPDDEYKGDFARNYFYMATRYEDVVKGWISVVLSGNNTSVYVTWTINLLLKWHRQDPVSEKEIDRNNAVYGIQKNRNPFIDYPELVELIWGSEFGQPFMPGGEMPTISGSNFACERSENNVYETDEGKQDYVWTVSGGDIVGSSSNESVTVSWSEAMTGKVMVSYKDNGVQSATAEFNVDVRQRPVPTITGDRYILKNTESYTYKTEENKVNYLWGFSGNISLSEGGLSNDSWAVIDAGEEGNASISVNYTQNGCPAITPTVFQIDIVTSIKIDEQGYWKERITVAPNPSNGLTTITFKAPFSGIIKLYNSLGICLQQISVQSISQQTIDFSLYPGGLYILEYVTENRAQIHQKIIKY